MTLFDRLVDEALRAQTGLAPLRPVVEKELLHHDILRELAEAGLLHRLTFTGGTCLRACYGSHRLSEDLDFTGGADFDRAAPNSCAILMALIWGPPGSSYRPRAVKKSWPINSWPWRYGRTGSSIGTCGISAGWCSKASSRRWGSFRSKSPITAGP
jgi:hypothetical protein